VSAPTPAPHCRKFFETVYKRINAHWRKGFPPPETIHTAEISCEFTGELSWATWRYSTFGKQGIELLHPVLRSNNWETKNLVLAEISTDTTWMSFERLIDLVFDNTLSNFRYDHHARKIGIFLTRKTSACTRKFKQAGHRKGRSSGLIGKDLDLGSPSFLNRAKHWDGGYSIIGAIGHGMHLPCAILPASGPPIITKMMKWWW